MPDPELPGQQTGPVTFSGRLLVTPVESAALVTAGVAVALLLLARVAVAAMIVVGR
jgi:hypothetical protein